MRRMILLPLLALLFTGLFATTAFAQPTTMQAPTMESDEGEGIVVPDAPALLGPRDVINAANGAREAQERAEARAENQPSVEAVPADVEAAENQAAAQEEAISRERLQQALAAPESPATAEPSDEVPVGTIRITVVNADGSPSADTTIRLGIMGAANERSEQLGETDADGVWAPSGLATGTGQAYRVNVEHGGARFSTNPFQLPPNRGYEVRITKNAVTTDTDVLRQLESFTFIELKEGRLRVQQRVKIMNLGRQTYVFPEEGRLFELPDGFKAFQTDAVMSDQRLEPVDDGVLLRGSLPPGTVDLVWAFDLPLSGTEATIRIPVTMPVLTVQVAAQAPEGMTLDVEGLPEPEVRENQGARVLLTGERREPDDMSPIIIRLAGIPGPGPYRLLALGAMFIMMLAGFMFLTRKGSGASVAMAAEAREMRRQELYDEAVELEELFRESEVGPKYRAKRMREITAELAVLARDDESAKASRHLHEPSRAAAGLKREPRNGMIAMQVVLGFLLCGIFHLVAFNMATEDLADIKAGVMDSGQESRTRAYRWIALFSFGLFCVAAIAGMGLVGYELVNM